MSMNESQFQAKVIKFLKELPRTWYVKIWGGGFMKAGIPVKYEPKHFTLIPSFSYLGEKIRPITYLPDFIGRGFVVECKGLMGDSFPLRYKLFKYYLKRHHSKMKCFLVRNHKQVDEMIQSLIAENHGK